MKQVFLLADNISNFDTKMLIKLIHYAKQVDLSNELDKKKAVALLLQQCWKQNCTLSGANLDNGHHLKHLVVTLCIVVPEIHVPMFMNEMCSNNITHISTLMENDLLIVTVDLCTLFHLLKIDKPVEIRHIFNDIKLLMESFGFSSLL